VTAVKEVPRTVLPAIDKIKMRPTDLFEINTTNFSASLPPQGKITAKPDMSQAGRDNLAVESRLGDITEESALDTRTYASPQKTINLDMSIGKNSVVESEVDGLIKWANNLPDDI
jgi:hypothetical protein